MNLTVKILYLLLLWGVTSPVFASSASSDATITVNKKFGKPTMEEMNMTEYAQDPEADAVVLMQSCDVIYRMSYSPLLSLWIYVFIPVFFLESLSVIRLPL